MSSPLSNSTTSINNYITWYQTGQEQQTGLAIQAFIDINNGCTSAKNQLVLINSGIQSFKQSWGQFVLNPVTNMAGNFEQLLTVLDGEALELVTTASTTKSNAESLSAVVSAQISNLNVAIQNYNNQAQQSQVDYNNALNDYNSANSQLSGSSGFWNGFLTGLTLGIDNRIKQEMNAATNAMNSAQASLNAAQQASANSNQTQFVLNSCVSSLNQLSNLLSGLTDLQNSINSVSSSCKQGAQDEKNAANANDPAVINVFIKLATTPVLALIAFGDELNTLV